MSENKHTPGPWSAHEKGAHPNPYVCGAEREYEHGPDKPVVAYIVGTDTEANARLIAAAPELLDALELVRSIITEGAAFGFNPLEGGDWAERLYRSQAATAAAVKKAGGNVRSASS